MESQQSSDTGGVQSPKMCKACFEVIHPQAVICPKCGVRQTKGVNKTALALVIGGVGCVVVIAIIGILAAIAIPQFLHYQAKATCSTVEAEAERAGHTVSLFLIDTGSSEIPTLSDLKEPYGYTPNEKVAIEISGTIRNVIIKASDKSGKCTEGQYYILTIPKDPMQNGWQ